MVDAAARRGVGVYGVTPYRMSAPGPAGLIFGYSTLTERIIVEGIGMLANAVNEVRGQ